MEMKYFLLETQSDNGTHFLKTNASTKDIAIENFCNLYFAPKSAVLNCYEIDLMWFGYSAKTIITKKLFNCKN